VGTHGTHVRTHIHTHTHTHARMHTQARTQIEIYYLCICIYIYVCVCVYIYIYTHTHTYTEQVVHPDMLYSENNIKKFHNSFTQPCLTFRNDVCITIQVCTYQNWNVIFFLNTVYNSKYGGKKNFAKQIDYKLKKKNQGRTSLATCSVSRLAWVGHCSHSRRSRSSERTETRPLSAQQCMFSCNKLLISVNVCVKALTNLSNKVLHIPPKVNGVCICVYIIQEIISIHQNTVPCHSVTS